MEIRLTPKQFREFDILVRKKAGSPLSVFDSKDEPNRFGYYTPYPEGVYLNSDITEGPGCCREVSFIRVANQIDTDRFARDTEREIDRGAIPKDCIYRFIIFHEMSHKLRDRRDWEFVKEFAEIVPGRDFKAFEGRERLSNLFYAANEVRADRFAWESLFPGKLFPRRAEKNGFLEKVKKFMASHKEWFPSEPRKVDPISINPKEMIPISHIKKGIPWADL